ncbi:MAG: 16S rRNA (guanine(966)-N(2))-methyltransferase RsmD [bacterium]
MFYACNKNKIGVKYLRVIAGTHRGRRLRSVKGDKTRPTADRVKEALFNILQNRIYNSRFLDLYSGTGSIAIEALSRGAGQAVLVEEDKAALKVIERNLADLGLASQAVVLGREVAGALLFLGSKREQFDLIFLDPPYRDGKEEEVLSGLEDNDLLAAGGMVIVEHQRKNNLPDRVGIFYKQRVAAYGDTALAFYLKEEKD